MADLAANSVLCVGNRITSLATQCVCVCVCVFGYGVRATLRGQADPCTSAFVLNGFALSEFINTVTSSQHSDTVYVAVTLLSCHCEYIKQSHLCLWGGICSVTADSYT